MRISLKWLPLALGLAASTHAAWVSAGPLPLCNNADVRVTKYVGSPSGTASNWTEPATPINAAACAGAFAGNDMPVPSLNLGYKGDGLLNGAPQSTPPRANIFPGGAFMRELGLQYSDLQDDGVADDPGWIMLGRFDFDTNLFGPSAIGGSLGIVLSDFFSVTSTGAGTGTWAFSPDAGFTARADAILGKHDFDQFALVFKASTSFAAYDFSTEQFGWDSGELFGLQGSYDTRNTLRTSNGKNPAGISHISLWARDPFFNDSELTVPEPGTLALVGLAFAGLAFSRRRRAA